ncbi:GroES-like protein [Xylona heveae TC161]|uniref:GroES-like protein n=1 Tax=Xylona heveae (strain CBS 132557 / TC161) TaxID=1328760 RepID=A0A165K422_XYLHT|nr:GroES-like protein [Xylona heveae TC161]KZF26960.1 GroES-like protein [Xylona heveae TC161]
MAPNLPKTFKAALFKEANAPLVVEDVPLESPKHGEILIKVQASGVCHSDIMVQAGMMNSFPIIPGHETIGEIVAVGPDEKMWKVGDRAGGAWHGGHDGTCRECRRGHFQNCENEAINGVSRNGGYGEYATLRSEAAVPIPKDVDAAAYAPLLCAGVTVFNSIRNMGIAPGQTVAIQGLGGLGHLALQFAAKMGYKVVALSSSASKQKFAKELGAHVYLDGSKKDHVQALNEMGGAALVVCTAPNPELIGPLINAIQPRGKLLVLAPCGDISINTVPLVVKGLSVHGWPSGASLDSEETIEFAEVHGVNCLVEKFPLKDAAKAFQHMADNKARFRAVIVME